MESGIAQLIGKKIADVKTDNLTYIQFHCEDGSVYQMHHVQDCCESVEIDEINGDLNELIREVILSAEENSNNDNPKNPDWGESVTWTFYHIRTVKSTITIKWYGSSNGYYSESVDFDEIQPANATINPK